MLTYDVVDVFTDRPFAGNQLAVVHGAGDLTTAQCLAITREFNYSETTFPVPGDGDRYATRIFTPSREIPFAGHPTLGTAWVLRREGLVTGSSVVQECGAGEIGVSFSSDSPDSLVELSARPRDLSGPVAEDVLGRLLADVGLTLDDAAGPAYVAGTGLSFVHVPVVADAVARARVAATPLSEYGDGLGGAQDPVEGINLVSITGPGETDPTVRVHARVFVPTVGIAEDPATGSAAAGLGMALVAAGVLPEGGGYEIRQGIEMGRPSTLFGRVEAEHGVATRCHVAGLVQHIAHGEIAVPE